MFKTPSAPPSENHHHFFFFLYKRLEWWNCLLIVVLGTKLYQSQNTETNVPLAVLEDCWVPFLSHQWTGVHSDWILTLACKEMPDVKWLRARLRKPALIYWLCDLGRVAWPRCASVFLAFLWNNNSPYLTRTATRSLPSHSLPLPPVAMFGS